MSRVDNEDVTNHIISRKQDSEVLKKDLKLNLTLTLSRSQRYDGVFISVGDLIFRMVFAVVLESNCKIFSPENNTQHKQLGTAEAIVNILLNGYC